MQDHKQRSTQAFHPALFPQPQGAQLEKNSVLKIKGVSKYFKMKKSQQRKKPAIEMKVEAAFIPKQTLPHTALWWTGIKMPPVSPAILLTN